MTPWPLQVRPRVASCNQVPPRSPHAAFFVSREAKGFTDTTCEASDLTLGGEIEVLIRKVVFRIQRVAAWSRGVVDNIGHVGPDDLTSRFHGHLDIPSHPLKA